MLDRISSPETVFDVAFFSPDSVSLSISIDRLNPVTTSLEKYKDTVAKNLKGSYPDVKGVSFTNDFLAGKIVYRIESLTKMIDHWEKSVDLDAVENGTLYEVSLLGKAEDIKKYSVDIKNMLGSVEFNRPTVNLQQIYETQFSGVKQPSTRPNVYYNEKCGVAATLPKGWLVIPSDRIYKGGKTLADFQSADDDIFSLYLAIENIGYHSMSPADISDALREYATLGSDSIIIDSETGQIDGFPSYKIIHSEGSPGTSEYVFYTLDTLIIAYDREYRFVFEAADKAEFDKYRSAVENMAKTISIKEPNFEGINC